MRQNHTTDTKGMRSALLVGVGTSAGAILNILRWLLAGFRNPERLGVLHVDSDRTFSFAHLPIPLFQKNGADGWGPDAFVHIPPPAEDFVKSIQRGERVGYDHVPPAVLDTLNGDDGIGVGGIVLLGNAAGILHEPRVRSAIRRAINRITDHRTEFNDHGDAPLVVFEIAGCLGGTWGALEPVHDVIVDEAHRMGIQVSFQRTILFPGIHPARDMGTSMANAAAWLQEFAATASSCRLRLLRLGKGEPPRVEPAQTGPVWVVSDMNNAPGKTSTVTTSELFTLVAYWHWLWLATPLGARLEQTLVDFHDDALGVDANGERRVGRTFGISFITMNHERIESFSAMRLVRLSLEALHGPVDIEEVEGEVRQFNRNHRLHEGANFAEVSNAIRSTNASGQMAVDQVARFRNLFDANLAGLEGVALLRDGPGIADTTVAQTADTAARFRASREALVDHVVRDIDAHVLRWLWDPERGASYTQAWLAEGKRVFDRMVDLASNDLRQHEEQINKMSAAVQTMEAEAIPRFLNMGPIRRWFNRGPIQTLAEHYFRTRRALEMARKEGQARAEAIEALRAIGAAFEARHTAITALIDELAAASNMAGAEEERIRQWDGTLHNPNGFRLDDDLESCYRQVIARLGDKEAELDIVEQRAVHDLLVELGKHGDLLALSAEPGRIARELETIARNWIQPRVAALHVEDELFRRYPPGSEKLRRFMRERDRQAMERLTFSGTAEHDNPVHLLRFVCADSRRGTEIVRAVNDASYTRAQAQGNVQYELIGVADPQRITLVQVRLSFPPSQIGLYPACVSAYADCKRTLQFERNHTDLVGRYLPRPGMRSTPDDARIALVKAFAIPADAVNSKPAPLELVAENGVSEVVLIRWNGQRETLGTDLSVERHIARQYDVRVELATRFYTTWRIHGPDELRSRVLLLGAARAGKLVQPDPLALAIAPLVNDEAIQAVLDEMAWYKRNTDPNACLWSRSDA